MIAKFQSSRRAAPTYICGDCGKRTRPTGHGEESCELCAYCYRKAELENAMSDGYLTEAEYEVRVAALDAEYGRGRKVVTAGRPDGVDGALTPAQKAWVTRRAKAAKK